MQTKYFVGDIVQLPTGNIEILEIYKKNNYRTAKYKCLVCGCISERRTSNLTNYGCPGCLNYKAFAGINDVTITDSWMIPYFQGGEAEAKQYTRGSNKKIHPFCPYCGRVKKREMSINEISSKKSIGCICGDGISYPNKFMYALLSQLNIDFENEYMPNWIKPKRYDFYIPSLGLIIEMDGCLGHGKKSFTNDEDLLKRSIDNDIYKDREAKKHNLNVIRINVDESKFDYIIFKIIENLNTYFDLSKINWEECERFALSNRVKCVCEEYEKYKPISTTELADKLHMNRNVVYQYLCKGQKIGWTTYNVAEAKNVGRKKSRDKIKMLRSKPVYIYNTNGNFIAAYPSSLDVQEKSISDFGFYLSKKSVCNCCNGKLNSYKGLIFTYEKGDINLECNFRIQNRKVYCYNLQMTFICEYNSGAEASKTTGISNSSIHKCCKGKFKTAGGYIWRYADEVQK